MPETTANAPLTLLAPGETIRVWYKNWRGETSIREIELNGAPHWGRTQWHPEPCWLITGTDIIKNEDRVWSIADMRPVS